MTRDKKSLVWSTDVRCHFSLGVAVVEPAAVVAVVVVVVVDVVVEVVVVATGGVEAAAIACFGFCKSPNLRAASFACVRSHDVALAIRAATDRRDGAP